MVGTSDGDAPSERRRVSPLEEVLGASGGRRELSKLPRLIAQAFSLVWRAAPRNLLTAGLLQVLAGLALVAQLFVLRRFLDVGITATTTLASIAPLLAAFGGLLALVAIATLAQQEQQRVLGEYVQKYTTMRVMDVSTTVDLIEYDRPGFYDHLQRARINASSRPMQIAKGVIGLIGSLTAVLALGATLISVFPLVAVVIAVGGIPAIFLNRSSSRIFHRFAVRQTPRDRRREYLYHILSRKEEAQEVRAFDCADVLRSEHARLHDLRIEDLRRTLRKRFAYGATAALIAAVVTIGSISLLILEVQSGGLSVADAAVALGALVLVVGRIRGLIGSTGSLYEGALFLEDFTRFVAVHEQTSRTAITTPHSETSRPGFETIELRNVGFTYPSRDTPSLQQIDLTIRPGEVIALVGENGSGKTTLTKLLAGLYRPGEGSLYWDGVPVEDMDPIQLRRRVAVIFQDYARYFLSAADNIAISQPSKMEDREAVDLAARQAGADQFIAGLPDGYDTLLGPSFIGGSDLSTGQWQRVALARAYFRDAPLLILDEPTASVDPRGEYEIFQQVRKLAAGRTVVLVSHRFSSCRAADRILVLEGGRIVEQGGHDELLASDGLYAELFTLQADGYRGA